MYRLICLVSFTLLFFAAFATNTGKFLSFENKELIEKNSSALDTALSVKVTHINKTYSTDISATIKSKPEVLFNLLTSYNKLETYSQLIQKSQLLPNGHLLLNLKTCFLFICFYKQQELELAVSMYSVTGRIVPDRSDFTSGWVKWKLHTLGENSNISFASEMIPNFWVPPIIGPLLIKSKLRNEAEYSIQQLETLSHAINGR